MAGAYEKGAARNGNGQHDANIALLIDADNASPDALDAVLTVLAELGTVNVRRAYGNWSKQALSGWRDMTVRHGIEPQQQFDITKGKNATDMKMTIDAMDLLHHGRVDGFGIMSSDGDFMPLAVRIKQEGLKVYGFGNPTTPEAFQKACTRFIDVTALKETVEEDAEAKADVDVDEDLLNLLGGAYKAAKRDEQGFARLSEVGQLAGNRSSFDVRNYGFRRLSDLMKASPYFLTEEREGALFVKRLR